MNPLSPHRCRRVHGVPSQPLPEAQVRTIVKTRVAERTAQRGEAA